MESEIKGIPFNWPREGSKGVFGEGSLLVFFCFFLLDVPQTYGKKTELSNLFKSPNLGKILADPYPHSVHTASFLRKYFIHSWNKYLLNTPLNCHSHDGIGGFMLTVLINIDM